MPIQYFWRHSLAEQVREEGREEGRKQGRKQGRAEVRAEMVLNILRWRGIDVPDVVRSRVEGCFDLDQLETWARRAVHATDAADLFVGDRS